MTGPRILVLGAGGMLGTALFRRLSGEVRTFGTVRSEAALDALGAAIPDAAGFGLFDADDEPSLREVMETFEPAVVFNCIGVIKQAGGEPAAMVRANALFPHLLARATAAAGARLVHFSTDCVFSGAGGPYREDAPTDPQDLYGKSKAAGEPAGPDILMLRTSFVGHARSGGPSLLDWFVRQRGGAAEGYAGALYTGVSTAVLADLAARIVRDWPGLAGTFHVAGEAISKYDLLQRVNDAYGLGVRLTRNTDFRCDRRLDGSAFMAATGWRPPSWDAMIAGLRDEYRTRDDDGDADMTA